MLDVLTKAGCFAAIVALGMLLRKMGVFKNSDFSVLSNITLKITLPAAVISNYANRELDPALLSLALLGLLSGMSYICVGYFLNLHRDKEQRAFEMLNLPGYNIGCFGLPFIQSFLGPAGVVAACLFDTGNGFIGLGGAYGIASMVKDGGRFSFKRILRTLLKSVPFVFYLIMPALCLAHVQIPEAITSFAEIIADANAFIAMLMLGVGFNLTANRAQIGRIFRVLSVRYAVSVMLAAAFYFLLPFSLEVRKTLMLLVFTPIASAVPAFTNEMNSDVGLSSAINSISIICSVVFMVMLMILVP